MIDKSNLDSFSDRMGDIPKKIDHYEIVKSLGSGGMGEVFLAYDPHCERHIALKRIKTKLISHTIIRKRFMKEARYASKLSHPNIIPIYAIHESPQNIYYTMPFIEGETLKDILKKTKVRERKGLTPHEIGVSIPALIRIFLNTCQAVAFCHSKGILHRDLKPENIMVGKFNEVFLLDWGIATDIQSQTCSESVEEELSEANPNLTSPGKVLGTVNYMAPERAVSSPASIETDLYALGVILYQVLTLNFPFRRQNLDHFRKSLKFERIIPPEESAPYRDIPKQLSLACMRCLESDPSMRFTSVDCLIELLNNYIEGRPQWVKQETLSIDSDSCWEFQEIISVSKHLALTRAIDFIEWVALMISKNSFPGNLRIEFEIKQETRSSGLGVLLSVPEKQERQSLSEGFCVWIGSKTNPKICLFRSNVELMSVICEDLEKQTPISVSVEKVDNALRVYINGHILLNYFSHIPMIGTKVGLIYKEQNFQLSEISVFSGSQSAMVNCLSIPDILLASKNFDSAFKEYKKIAQSFFGRTEGHEAQFRAGLTLLKKAEFSEMENKQALFEKAFLEFEQLKGTPAAPLEYLGKSLIYRAENETDEELKSLEICLRKYERHPLLPIIKEQVVFSLHESSNSNRHLAYGYALMALRLIPEIFEHSDNARFLAHLEKHWIPLDFIDTTFSFYDDKSSKLHKAIQLAFWIKQPKILCEIIEKIPDHYPEKKYIVQNAQFCLYHMNEKELLQKLFLESSQRLHLIQDTHSNYLNSLFRILLSENTFQEKIDEFIQTAKKPITFHELRIAEELFLLGFSCEKCFNSLDKLLTFLNKEEKCDRLSLRINLLEIKLAFLKEDEHQLKKLFSQLPEKHLENKPPLLFFYACYQGMIRDKKTQHKYFESLSLKSQAPFHEIAKFILKDSPINEMNRPCFFDFEKTVINILLLYFYISKKDYKTVKKLKQIKQTGNTGTV